MAMAVLPVLEGLRDDTLRSFTWKMGTCIPRKILGPSGYLARKQTQIKSLVLVTGKSHNPLKDQLKRNISDLSAFVHLRKIS
ncbi:hypothetical protein NX059_009760 [Plenodomus lindquistii]|nr:hypothetical protein NX059_009760 [Plenodomus lindquistii]